MAPNQLSSSEQEQLQAILFAIATYVFLFGFYKLFRYIWFSIQLMAIANKLDRPKIAWMAWVPGFRAFQIALLGKRPMWIVAWIVVYIPSQIIIIYLFLENLNDMIETGVKIAHGDILGFLSELIGEDYTEAYLLSIAVAFCTSVPLLLYARLAQVCNRSELWSIPIRMIPIVNLVGMLWLRWGAGNIQKSNSYSTAENNDS